MTLQGRLTAHGSALLQGQTGSNSRLASNVGFERARVSCTNAVNGADAVSGRRIEEMHRSLAHGAVGMCQCERCRSATGSVPAAFL